MTQDAPRINRAKETAAMAESGEQGFLMDTTCRQAYGKRYHAANEWEQCS